LICRTSPFGAQTTLAYAANGANAGGTLTVRDGRYAASIALLGNYIAGSFIATVGGHGGTLVTEGNWASSHYRHTATSLTASPTLPGIFRPLSRLSSSRPLMCAFGR
jgi:hypothetical protein